MAKRGVGLVAVVVAVLLSVLATPGATMIIAPEQTGRTLFVDQAGEESSACTLARPCRSIVRAIQLTQPGDTVLVATGRYAMPRIGSSHTGLVVVSAAYGASVVIEGNVAVDSGRIMLRGLTVEGVVSFGPGAAGSGLLSSSAWGFNIFGADDILVQSNGFDGGGRVAQNILWDLPAANPPTNWRILGNTFANYYDGAMPSNHSEALYVGYSTNGLIEGNAFTNNGNTSHIFFTWFGSLADPSTSYPRSICVRRNTFNQTHGAYTAIAIRPEIPVSAGIRIDPSNVGASTTSPAFNGQC